MFFYLGDFSHTMVLAQNKHIYFGSLDNFCYLIFAMYLRTTLLYTSCTKRFLDRGMTWNGSIFCLVVGPEIKSFADRTIIKATIEC